MRRWLPVLLGLACLAPAAARAEEGPTPGKLDSRMRVIAYDPEQVVHLSTAAGATFSIGFAADETVVEVAVSDSNDLHVLPVRNFLFMKAAKQLPLQPLIVLTSRPNGALRRYVFEIATTAAGAPLTDNAPGIYYSVQFTYPKDAAAAKHAAAVAAAKQRAARRAARHARYELVAAHRRMEEESRDPFFGARNYRYVAQGDRGIGPLEVWDNGFSTIFRFPGNIRVPSIFVIDPDGKEATPNYTVKGNWVEVDAVARQWRLRDGNTVLCVFNLGYDPIGDNPGTGTISPEVRRVTNEAPP